MTPSRLHKLASADETAFPPEVAAAATRALADGGFVALPTETVYGLAARADSPAALAALARAKGGSADRAWTWHVGTPTALETLPVLSPLVRRLAARYWPGPLTLVVPGPPAGLEGIATDGWIGIRLPAHDATASLLAALDFPVVMTSANASGEPPLASATEIARAFPDVALVVDAGPPRIGEASAVLRVGRGRFDLLRTGLYELATLRATAGRAIAFCCTGNTCRSPMAEGIAKARIAERLELDGADPLELERFGFHVTSMGLAAAGGLPVSPHSVEAAAAHGIDVAGHTSRSATPALLSDQDEIYGLTRAHVDALRYALPPQTAIAIDLLDPDGEDVPDPIGGSLADYEHSFRRIAAAIAKRVEHWA